MFGVTAKDGEHNGVHQTHTNVIIIREGSGYPKHTSKVSLQMTDYLRWVPLRLSIGFVGFSLRLRLLSLPSWVCSSGGTGGFFRLIPFPPTLLANVLRGTVTVSKLSVLDLLRPRKVGSEGM